MKKLLLSVIIAVLPACAHAAISVDSSTNEAVLRNQGYSGQTAEMVSVGKARALGQEYYTEGEIAYKKQSKFAKFWRKLYVYTDPAAEDYSFYHHDTVSVPGYTDL